MRGVRVVLPLLLMSGCPRGGPVQHGIVESRVYPVISAVIHAVAVEREVVVQEQLGDMIGGRIDQAALAKLGVAPHAATSLAGEGGLLREDLLRAQGVKAKILRIKLTEKQQETAGAPIDCFLAFSPVVFLAADEATLVLDHLCGAHPGRTLFTLGSGPDLYSAGGWHAKTQIELH